MMFIKQIRHEIRNILRSKFILIIAILVLAGSILLPVAYVIVPALRNGLGGGIIRPPFPIDKVYAASSAAFFDKGGRGDQESITVNGVTIPSTNPFYWNIKSMIDQKASMEVNQNTFSKPEVLDLVLAMFDTQIDFMVKCAIHISDPQDYRQDLVWRIQYDTLYDKFIYDNIDKPAEDLIEASNYWKGSDPETFRKKYIDVTPQARLEAQTKVEDTIATILSLIANDDFPKYIELRIQQENDQIAMLNDSIALLTQQILENPALEENNNMIIQDQKRQIKMINENNIPILEFRLEKNIVPGKQIWQNTAISQLESSQMDLIYHESNKKSEEDFMKDQGLIEQYKTYQNYLNEIQKQINKLTETKTIALNSLNAGKPDMKYVPDGARSETVRFLDFSVAIAMFGVLLGGWLIASEHQQGTIRLLMIRPKTRIKILTAKFLAALIICLVMYLAGSLLNIVANGICFGFGDLAYPNYTISGEINFFAFYLPKLLACVLPILFGFAVAFMLSVLVKNTAVAIAVPLICYVGCYIVMTYFHYRPEMSWIAYTPVPYIQLSSFFIDNSPINMAIQNGITFSMPLGIIMLVALTAASMIASIFVFKKRDITN